MKCLGIKYLGIVLAINLDGWREDGEDDDWRVGIELG